MSLARSCYHLLQTVKSPVDNWISEIFFIFLALKTIFRACTIFHLAIMR